MMVVIVGVTMNIDKIPIKMMTKSPGDDDYHLGTITITKGEYANSEKINEILDYLIEEEIKKRPTMNSEDLR